jgi:16S rRNA (adenine1518-N6/adenine1519-N6)-dimethyltransferase
MESPRELLRRRGLRPKKSWGQNFLGDPEILRRIAEATRAGPDDTVVELGAGLGHLTHALLALGSQVIAVERDRDMAAALRINLEPSPRLRILEANAATLELATLSQTAVTVVGNLPYQLSSAILFKMLEQRASIRRLVFLLQAEFVERMGAGPGGRDYGVLSIQAQAVATVTPLFQVPASAFHPRPAVDSAVVELVPLERPRVAPGLSALFTRVVRGAFQQRRKTLANALTGAGFEQAREALLAAGIDSQRRAETLAIEDFVDLTRQIGERDTR